MNEIIFEKSSCPSSYIVPDIDIKDIHNFIPEESLREDFDLPNLGELDVVRHFISLSQKNFCVDTNFYPLGSCTMKYNPKVNEEVAQYPLLLNLHPYQEETQIQGALEIFYDLENVLCEITGMSRFTFQPCAGAHGELTGILIIKKYHEVKGNKKTKILIPYSAHGTNPASAAVGGYEVIEVNSNNLGLVDFDDFKNKMKEDVAGVMLTNPNTLGLFEKDILKISELAHKYDALLYYDGANFNPLLGITKPSLMGFDIIHLNLHKTFSTPHGSGGPGAGALGVVDKLCEFLPVPLVEKNKKGKYFLNYNLKHTIGRVRSFLGNYPVLIKAYAYILSLGKEGLRDVAYHSVLNANYIREKLKNNFKVAYPYFCMHEVVFSAYDKKEKGVSALDIAKRLIDYKIHPPTIYFPSIVKEAIMVEPTECESKNTLDYFIEVMKKIDKEIDENPNLLKEAPHNSRIRRVDETLANRSPDLRWKKDGN